jgi:hypothetical protein
VLGDDKVDGKQNNDVIARINSLCGHRHRGDSEADGGGGIAADMVFPHPLWHQALTRKVCTHTFVCATCMRNTSSRVSVSRLVFR